ncbi:MAG: hypothetical protein ABH845_01535 [Candidatus Omnitrophota bacterium]
MDIFESKRHSRSHSGFLLFELLVSVVVLSICLTLISRSFIHSLTALQSASDVFQAGLLLEKKVLDLEERPSFVTPGHQEGIDENTDGKFRWIVDVEEAENTLLAARVSIRWNPRGRQQELAAETYLPISHED